MHVHPRPADPAREQGFTLIELLVVIIIVGILAAIAVPVFLNQRKKGVDASLKSDVKAVATQMEAYYTDNDAYPTAVTAATGSLAVGSATVFLSPGNTVTTKASAQAFVVCAWNGNGTASGASNAVIYRSAAGGLQTSFGNCATASP